MSRNPTVSIATYKDIVESMYLGMSINEICIAYGVPKNALRTCNNRRAILLKTLQVFSVQAILTGNACKDPDFIRMSVGPKEFKTIHDLIENEEEKLKIPLHVA